MQEIPVPQEFIDIQPIPDSDFDASIAKVMAEPVFDSIIDFMMPGADHDQFRAMLKQIHDKEEFQKKIMIPILINLANKTTLGVSCSGLDKLNHSTNSYTHITNHRDIILDASYLNYLLITSGNSAAEVAIGNNLFVYEWIELLARLNKCFIVKRNLPVREALTAARQLSSYIHFAIDQKHQSVWIAQREGRAKDSNDVTQESLIKMLALGGAKDKDIIGKLKELNLCPIALSYEYDATDYLKIIEFVNKRRNPEYKKTKQDDLINMQTGILGFKGHIHYVFATCINDELDAIEVKNDKTETYKLVCEVINRAIHSNYRIYPCNLIAYDRLNNSNKFAGKYSADEAEKVNAYFNKQLEKAAKVLGGVSDDERAFMEDMLLKIYANPLINKLKVCPEEC